MLLTVVAMIILAVGGRVYNDRYLTALEIFSHINIICLCLMNILFTCTDDSYSHVMSINVIVSVSVSIEILLFVVIVTVHCYLALNTCTVCKRTWPGVCRIWSRCNLKLRVPRHTQHQHQPLIPVNADRAQSPDDVAKEREPMIFEVYLD